MERPSEFALEGIMKILWCVIVEQNECVVYPELLVCMKGQPFPLVWGHTADVYFALASILRSTVRHDYLVTLVTRYFR